MSVACKVAGVPRRTAYDRRESDEQFAAAWDEALEAAADVLEAEAVRRAVQGVEKPVYQGGEMVGTVQEYSDTLLIFLLKGNRPEKFRERHTVEHTGKGGGPVVLQVLKNVSLDEL